MSLIPDGTEIRCGNADEPTDESAPPPARKLTLAEWKVIEDDCTHPDHPLSFADAGKKYGVSQKTIAKRATRKQWPVPRIIAKTIEGKLEAAVARVASKWADKGERHREVVFNLAHESLKKMKPKPPKNFREAEAADKMARRAAGLEVVDVSQQTLIQINEAIDAHVTPVEDEGNDVQDAEIVPITVAQEPTSAALPNS